MSKKLVVCVIAVLCLALSGLVYAQETKTEPVLKMSASTPKSDVAIGDWIQIDLVLTNLAATTTDIIKPIIDIDSVSFAIRHLPITGTARSWNSAFSRITPSVYDHSRQKLEKVTLGMSGTPEAELKASFTLPAVEAAVWEIIAYYQGWNTYLMSEPMKVTINAPKSDDGTPKKGELITVIETSTGTMTCKFFFRDAPNSVMSFCKLAKEGFYNNLTFHRIIKDFMIQGGDPKGDGSSGPGFSIKSEVNPHKHLKGTMAMARSTSLDSAGSQFYICLDAKPHLDKDYTAFGELVDGMSVLEAIGNTQTTGSAGNPPDRALDAIVIKSITLEFREVKADK